MHILLVDDHALFREALLHVLNQLGSQTVIFEAANAEEAGQLISHANNLDLILLDIDLPGVDGLTALPSLRGLAPTVPIVVLSGSETSQHVKQALDNGAVGYIPKSCSSHEMLAALHIVMQGDIYIPPKLLGKISSFAITATDSCDTNHSHATLTARQIDVLDGMAKGLPNKSIAKELDMAEGTVKLHVAAILRLLGARNRTEAVVLATQLGLLSTNNHNNL